MARNDMSTPGKWLATMATEMTTTPDPVWNSHVADYLRLNALARANYRVGPYARARDILGQCPEDQPGESDKKEMFAEYSAAAEAQNERFLTPMWAAAVEMAAHPAPTLAAAMFKAEIIRMEELENDAEIVRRKLDTFKLTEADMERLAA